MPKIFDCFAFFNELDILDARLHELSPVVDRFVLVEAKQTFTGKPKSLIFEENRNRYAEFLQKIEYVVVDFPTDMSFMYSNKCTSDAWAREHYQRNQFSRGLQQAQPDDLVIVSDVDEIISASALERAVSNRRRGDLNVFTMPVYAHFVNRKVAPTWEIGPRMIEYRWFPGGQKLRHAKLHGSKQMRGTLAGTLHTRAWNLVFCSIPGRVVEVTNAGWHLSSIGGWDEYRKKISSYSHAEFTETDAYRCETAYQQMVLNDGELVDSSLLPEFVRAHPAMFPLLERIL